MHVILISIALWACYRLYREVKEARRDRAAGR